MDYVNLIITFYVTAIYLSKTTSDLLDLQVKLLKENYTGRAHTFFEKVTKKLYLDDLRSVGTSGPRLNRLPSLPISDRHSSEVPHFTKIVKQFGYDGEEHRVTTPDGYILGIHRISGGPKTPKAPGKPVVLIQHGLLESSDWFVIMGPSKDLSKAYMFVDAGYDVWLNNIRGNTYSRSHVTLSPSHDPQFWQYSFHEMALYDVTTAIDYILDMTGQEKLIYVGHSMGTTMSYVLLSQLPEYNKKMRLVISLAPVAFWYAEPRPAIRFVRDKGMALQNYFASAKIYEILPFSKFSNVVSGVLCSENNFINYYCSRLYSFLFGPNRLDLDVVSYTLRFFPAGTSRQTLDNFYQNIVGGDFRMYSLGSKGNLRKYGKEEPPNYKIKNIVAPVALYYGNGDALASPDNVITLSKKLPNVIALVPVGDEKFNHVDFLFTPDVKKVLNDPILKLVKNFLGDKINI